MGGPPSLGPEPEAALLGLGDLLLMAVCSLDDYLLPHVEQMTCVALSTTGGKTHTGKPAPRHCERGEKRGGMTLPIVDQALRLDKCPCWDPDAEQAVTAQDHQPSFGLFRSQQRNAVCANGRAQAWETQTWLRYQPAVQPWRAMTSLCSCFQPFPSLSYKPFGRGFWFHVCKQERESCGVNLLRSEQHF